MKLSSLTPFFYFVLDRSVPVCPCLETSIVQRFAPTKITIYYQSLSRVLSTKNKRGEQKFLTVFEHSDASVPRLPCLYPIYRLPPVLPTRRILCAPIPVSPSSYG